MKLKYGIGIAASLVGASPAAADDVKTYIGALAGWDHVSIETPLGEGSKDGLAYGGVIGVDYVMQSGAIFGLETEAMGATTSQTEFVGPTETIRLKAGRDFYIGVRAGAVVASHLLAYVKGGYSNARATLRYTDSSGSIADSENLDGWRIGGGAEVALPRSRVRLEYRYSDYGEFRYQGIATGVKANRHQVVLGALFDL